MNARRFFALATISLWLVPALAVAEEWTRFRGPNGTGESEVEGIPVTWTEKDFNSRRKPPAMLVSTH